MRRPPGWFAESLRALPPARFRAFVADLWRARGYTVRAAGPVLVVANGQQRRLRPVAAGEHRPVRPDVDLVVGAVAGARPDAVGPAELAEHYRYAVDEAAAARLRRQYLRPAASAEATPGRVSPDRTDRAPAGADPGGSADTAGSPTRRGLLAAGGGFLLGVASVATLGLVGPDDVEPSAGDPSASTPAPAEAVRPWPPGLSTAGVADVDRLVDAHTGRLASAAYTVSITRTVHGLAGDLRSTLGLRVAVVDREFAAELSTGGPSGRLLFGERAASAELWSRGDRVFRRLTVAGETDFRAFAAGGGVSGAFYWANVYPFQGQAVSTADFLRWLLGGADLSVAAADDSPDAPVAVLASGGRLPPRPGEPHEGAPVDLERLHGTVTNAGLVRSLRFDLADRVAGEPRRVTWSMAYSDVGDTTVQRPAWLDRFLIDDVLI